MLPAVPKGSDSFLEAAVPLTFPPAAGLMEPALALRWAWAGLFHGDKGRQSSFTRSCTHSFIHLVIMCWYPQCVGRCPNGIQPRRLSLSYLCGQRPLPGPSSAQQFSSRL